MEKFASPAKLNLMLRVVGQREDGYHLLETVFTLIDLYDWITITPRSDSQIILADANYHIPLEDDLAIRAAKILQKTTQCPLGAEIQVHKTLPMGGGLGGGSSNAATVLMALNHLWECGLSRQELMNIGVQIGADVPFFIFGQTAFAQGIGEKLEPYSFPEQHYVIIRPPVSIATAKIFHEWDLTHKSSYEKIQSFGGAGNNVLSKQLFCNDLQDIVLKHYPDVVLALSELKKYGNAVMTGSGSCVFVAVKSRTEAEEIASQLRSSFEVFVASSLKHHPLFHLLE